MRRARIGSWPAPGRQTGRAALHRCRAPPRTTMASEAPKAAPADTPRKPESTSGLRKIIWNTQPGGGKHHAQSKGGHDAGQAQVDQDVTPQGVIEITRQAHIRSGVAAQKGRGAQAYDNQNGQPEKRVLYAPGMSSALPRLDIIRFPLSPLGDGGRGGCRALFISACLF